MSAAVTWWVHSRARCSCASLPVLLSLIPTACVWLQLGNTPMYYLQRSPNMKSRGDAVAAITAAMVPMLGASLAATPRR